MKKTYNIELGPIDGFSTDNLFHNYLVTSTLILDNGKKTFRPHVSVKLFESFLKNVDKNVIYPGEKLEGYTMDDWALGKDIKPIAPHNESCTTIFSRALSLIRGGNVSHNNLYNVFPLGFAEYTFRADVIHCLVVRYNHLEGGYLIMDHESIRIENPWEDEGYPAGSIFWVPAT